MQFAKRPYAYALKVRCTEKIMHILHALAAKFKLYKATIIIVAHRGNNNLLPIMEVVVFSSQP